MKVNTTKCATLLLSFIAYGCGDYAPDTVDAEERERALPELSIIASGAKISGANGIHFGPDGLLYVASVMGSELLALDPETGEVKRRLNQADGVNGPDDIAFAPDGAFFWTAIMTGEVAGFNADGELVVAAELTPGVNPLTFSDDGRLFVSQCFFDDKLYEVDPAGKAKPRLIADDLGPGCGLNGMDWGPDGRLYGPRWFQGEVVSFDVDTGERRTVIKDLGVPASVKFDSQGRLHVLDTDRGQIVRVEGDASTVAAQLMPGLDNFAFDRDDRLFVSSFTDGFVGRVESDGSLSLLSPGGIAHPGGVAVHRRGGKSMVVVADFHAIRAFDPHTGDSLFAQRNIVGIGPMGTTVAIAADGENLILVSFLDNSVRIWDPVAEQILKRWDDLDLPVSAVRYGDGIAVAEHGTGRVIWLSEGAPRVLAEGFDAPTGLATDGDKLFLTDRSKGQIFQIAQKLQPMVPKVIAQGLIAPEGIDLMGQDIIVIEGESGRVLRIRNGEQMLLATVAPGSAPVSATQPPSLIYNDVAVDGDSIFVTGERDRVLYRIDSKP